MSSNEKIDLLRQQYQAALLANSSAEATGVVDQAVYLGIPTLEIYLQIVIPAQVALGEAWTRGDLTVSEEHIATQITIHQLARLRDKIQPKPPIGVRAVVGTLEGDLHQVGAQVVSDFLYEDGWKVDYLGVHTPVDEIVRYVKQKKARLLAISISNESFLPALKELSRKISEIKDARPLLVVGGALFRFSHFKEKELGVDLISTHPKEMVSSVRELAGIQGSPASVDQMLLMLGSQVLYFRKLRKFSQVQLAESAGLDRAYISSFENGKKNISVVTLQRICEALSIQVSDLFSLNNSRGSL